MQFDQNIFFNMTILENNVTTNDLLRNKFYVRNLNILSFTSCLNYGYCLDDISALISSMSFKNIWINDKSSEK